MFTKADITGTRVAKTYRIKGPRTRDRVTFRCMPRTHKLLVWLSTRKKSKAPWGKSPGYTIDYLPRIFYWHFMRHYHDKEYTWPDKNMATLDLMQLLIDEGFSWNRSRLLDLLTAWAYFYDGGKRLCW